MPNIKPSWWLCLLIAPLSACQSTSLAEPCDVLVPINPQPATNAYLVQNDRTAAVAIAQHRGRYQKYGCRP